MSTDSSREGRSGPWAKRWVYFWEPVFRSIRRAWRNGVRPHLMPHRHAREHYESWVDFRLPPRVEGYVWTEEGDGWIGIFRYVDGPVPLELCCFQGETEEECKESIRDFLRDCEKNAGMYDRRIGWGIAWFNEEPQPRENGARA